MDDIVSLTERDPELEIYSPPATQREHISPGGERNRRSQMEHEPDAVKAWRGRMAGDAGKEVYRRRKLTEHSPAKMQNRGFARMPVHGLEAVRGVCFLHAIAHNFVHAAGLRRRAA